MNVKTKSIDQKETSAVIRLAGISKHFGGIQALDNVELTLIPGKVTALIGENGAGKSTLVKILTGIYQADAGTIFLDGESVTFPHPKASQNAGIAVIHQEIAMFDEITVAENIYMGHIPGKPFLFNKKYLFEESRALLAKLEIEIAPEMKLGDLNVAEKHLVGMARALSHDARVIIMDEPSAALSRQEILKLYTIIKTLRTQGKAILFISHKFDEIFEICDRYTVFRDGQFMGEGEIKDTHVNTLISLMVGRDFEEGLYPKRAKEHTLGEVALEARELGNEIEFTNISFSVCKGEIIGFYGLIGAGRSELMQAIFGISPFTHGELYIDGIAVNAMKSSREAVSAGLAYLPEDRQHQGLFLSMSISDNVTIVALRALLESTRLRRGREEQIADETCRDLRVKYDHSRQAVQELSGGNQQKVVIAKWLATQPKVLIIDEPTKGIDIGSKRYVHEKLNELAEAGMAIVMVSSELPEVIGLSDRIFVMREGRLIETFSREKATAEKILKVAL